MHSSRMRTGRSLTVFRSLQPGGVYLVPGCTWSRGVPGPREGCTWSRGGVYLVPGRGVPGPGGTWSRGGIPDPGGCTWSWGGVPGPGGVYLVWGGTWSQGGCTWSQGVPGPGGGYLVPGGVPGQVLPPPVNRMTNRCKNITLAKTSFRPVIRRRDIVKGCKDLFTVSECESGVLNCQSAHQDIAVLWSYIKCFCVARNFD